jgi:uncharacterized protein YprB with RNaseH-like and TPR domain
MRIIAILRLVQFMTRDLTTCLNGTEIVAPSGEAAFLVCEAFERGQERYGDLCDRFYDATTTSHSTFHRQMRQSKLSFEPGPEHYLFLDLETTGLSCCPLFLIGTMAWEGNGFVVRQFFARHYDEESATVSLLAEMIEKYPVLVTFNGKTFDWPFVRQRAVVHGIDFPHPRLHLDMLHVARKHWGRALPDCRLQTLETAICYRKRYGDIPGSDIPRAYRDFVETGDASEMAACLTHNMLDIITLADLMTRLPE